MPIDSTYLYSDTIQTLVPDSALLNKADSVQSDTIVSVFSGYEGLSHLSLPQSENWVFILLVGLFLLLAFAIYVYPTFISEDIGSIFRVKERTSIFNNSTASDSRFRVLFIVFTCCVISLYAYFILYDPGENQFSFVIYCYFLLATTLFLIFKLLIINLIGYVFFEPKTVAMARKSYVDLVAFFGIVLFPLLIINIYASPVIANVVPFISLGVTIVMFGLLILKLFQIFFSKLLDFFYILLYLCTLEILPVAVLFQAYKFIV